jgi:predicted nicotinamide N-methyase
MRSSNFKLLALHRGGSQTCSCGRIPAGLLLEQMPGNSDLENLRNRLLWRIHRRYVTTTSEVRVGQLQFPFTRIADPDSVLDAVAAEADRREKATGKRENDEHLHLPYWAELWDSAMGMAQFLVRDKETRRPGDKEMKVGARDDNEIGRQRDSEKPPAASNRAPAPISLSPCLPVSLSFSRTLDLGCGMGLSGTTAAALGARVTFADIEPPALLFARLNSLPWRRRVSTRRVNWKTDQLNEKFDLILGADIVYERAQWEFLEPFWRAHLKPGGTVMLGEPGRQTGDLFIQWIQSHGWQLTLTNEKVATRDKPITIMLLRKN